MPYSNLDEDTRESNWYNIIRIRIIFCMWIRCILNILKIFDRENLELHSSLLLLDIFIVIYCRNTAYDVVRSVILLGCSLEPTSVSFTQTMSGKPSEWLVCIINYSSIVLCEDLSLQESVVVSDTRTFRGQYSHVLTKGKW